mmetsp:Transcript_101220/g.314845  ORF Transcript_101220/g.314845 Transcript_101220/m.314845 type:complete len:272 (+) Transcript_101220:597-1412(+)
MVQGPLRRQEAGLLGQVPGPICKAIGLARQHVAPGPSAPDDQQAARCPDCRVARPRGEDTTSRFDLVPLERDLARAVLLALQAPDVAKRVAGARPCKGLAADQSGTAEVTLRQCGTHTRRRPRGLDARHRITGLVVLNFQPLQVYEVQHCNVRHRLCVPLLRLSAPRAAKDHETRAPKHLAGMAASVRIGVPEAWRWGAAQAAGCCAPYGEQPVHVATRAARQCGTDACAQLGSCNGQRPRCLWCKAPRPALQGLQGRDIAQRGNCRQEYA